VEYRDRATGELRTEVVYSESALRRLYETRLGRAALWAVARHEIFSHLYTLSDRLPLSRSRIARFVTDLGIDASEAARPLDQYRSLDDFFTRHLKPGVRPLDPDPSRLVAPADGRVLAYSALPETLLIKQTTLSAAALVGAAHPPGGACLVVRLAPADYHRFHFPASGEAGPAVRIGRGLHSVHPIALEAGAPAFGNKRMVTTLSGTPFGPITMIEVGALTVGTIVQTYTPGPVDRGAEKGTFRFGGSTVVMLFEPGRVILDDDLLTATADGLETFVTCRSAIGRRA